MKILDKIAVIRMAFSADPNVIARGLCAIGNDIRTGKLNQYTDGALERFGIKSRNKTRRIGFYE